MAEIAKDCDMSAGNLYRYFDNKKEIAAGSAQRCMQQKLELVREIIRDTNLSPDKKLQQFASDILEHIQEQFSNQPALMELVDIVSRERWDIVSH